MGSMCDPGPRRIGKLDPPNGQRDLIIDGVPIAVGLGQHLYGFNACARHKGGRSSADSRHIGGERIEQHGIDLDVIALGGLDAQECLTGTAGEFDPPGVGRELRQAREVEMRNFTGARIGLARGIAKSATVEIPPRIDRQPAAEDPRQQEGPADHAGDMMPLHPTAIRRHAIAAETVLAEAQAHDADHRSGERADDARARDPHHHLPPRLGQFAQRPRIQPVRDRAKPVPEPLAAVGIEHDGARAR